MGFLSQILKELEKRSERLVHFFVFDQASSHKSNVFTNTLGDSIPCVMTARNCPALNPIELLWADMKRSLSKKRIAERRDLILEIYNYFKSVRPEKAYKFCLHSYKYYEKSLKSDNFSGL